MLDVLIAGAGPAGSVAATLLARAGASVLLVDRARFPRDKLCGDTLNPGAMALLRRLGLAGPVDRDGLPVGGMILSGEHGVCVTGAYGEGVTGRAVTRRVLDGHLLAAAIDAGARFEEGVVVRGPVVGTGRRGACVQGVRVGKAGGDGLQIPARVTIAADGRRSALAVALGLARQPARPRRWACAAYFEGVAGLSAFGEMHVRRGFYLGVAPLPGGLANACFVSADRRHFRDPARALEGALTTEALLRERFASARRVSPVTTVGPLAVDAAAAGMPGLLLAGDAAGFIDPMTGDGLRFAVRGAELAARAALRLLETGEPMHDRLAAWRHQEFAAKWRLNRALRTLVASGAAIQAAGAVARLVPSAFQRLIAIAGDVDASVLRTGSV
jgi:flavin-dependent dehydrogenase